MTPEKIKTMSLEKLVELFEITGELNDKNIPTVRGWLMDAIAEKNPDGFDAWLDLEFPEDSDLRNYVL
jgi:hypothetical protein